MLVTLIKKTHISTLSLPEKNHGQYWVHDIDSKSVSYNLISIEAQGGEWEVRSGRFCKVLYQKQRLKSAVLRPGSIYELEIASETERSVLYTEETTKDRQVFQKYLIDADCELSIGRSAENDIVYASSFVSSKHASLSYTNGKWTVADTGSNNTGSTNGTFVNGKAVRGTVSVIPGDLIYIMGLKIVIGNGFLAINNPDGKVELNSMSLAKLVMATPKLIEDEEVSSPETVYFYRSPRFKRDIETAHFQIDPPPNDQVGDEMPFIMTVGPSITMGMASVVTGGFTIANALSTGNYKAAIPSIAMSGSMLLGTMLWPVINKQYEKKRKHKREALRQEKYAVYLEKMEEAIHKEELQQREILKENSLIPQECMERIENAQRNLWERGVGQNDFLEFRLGLGSVPLQAEIAYSQRRFTLDDDNLQEKMYQLCESPKILENVPISISLKEHTVTGIIGQRPAVTAFIKGMVLQLSVLYGYDEVKCVFLYDKEEESTFAFTQWLPHVWDDERRIRLIATDNTELKEVSGYLVHEIENRLAKNEREAEEAAPYYVIFAFSKELALRAEMLKQIYSAKSQLNISVVACFDELQNLPKECSTVVELTGNSGKLYDKNDISGQVISFLPDTLVYQDMLPITKKLANIFLDTTSGMYMLPQMLTFLEMFGVGKVEQLNPLARWKENDPTKSLEAAVGVNTLGDTFLLDLHQNYHGPHGLVAGMTGSGKSEFIITYILSLAVNYHPDEVAFVLIDYKGGGMAKSFERLPHVAGIITNLDGGAIKRSLASIESELTRRQAIFSRTTEMTGVSNIDIYKYQKLYRQRTVKEPLQHLFIIADEFAELKTQQPEFMEQLVSAARIGRSLGVHLILATQKPAGVVDDQIWSNTKFRVCLKVQDRSDSMDMLKRPEAAELSETGRFYLQVGYNEMFELGQSAWSGAPYYPTDRMEKKLEESVSVIDKNGRILKKVKLDANAGKIKNPKKQMDAVTDYLCKIAQEENIHARKLWLDPIPERIYINDILEKYHLHVNDGYVLNPLIGELDDPCNQSQRSVTLPLTEEGNAIIFGSAGTGKTTFLNAMIYSLMTEHTPDEVNLYLLDFASETLRAFTKAPHVGDVVLADEEEKVTNLFKMLLQEVARRKKLFANLGGDYKSCISSGQKVPPNIVIVIHNYAAFKELYEEQTTYVSFLAREGSKYGIYFVLSAISTGTVGFRLLQNFKQLITMQMNDETEYSTVVGTTDGLLPAKYKGRGLIKLDALYEFQAAYLTDEEVPFTYIQRCSQVLREDWDGELARKIPVLPEKVDIDFLSEYYDENMLLNVPVGVSASSMEVQYYPFFNHCVNLISSSDNTHSRFVNELIRLLATKPIDITVFDAEHSLSDVQKNVSAYYSQTEESNLAVHKLVEELLYRNNTYKDDISQGVQPKKYPLKLVVIHSLSSLMNALTEDEKMNLAAAFLNDSIVYNVIFIISEGVKKIVRYSFEKWYTKQVSVKDFIWIGDGITNQVQLTAEPITQEMRSSVSEGFGFHVRNGKAIKIKALGSGEETE